jgi:hypothetical protein
MTMSRSSRSLGLGLAVAPADHERLTMIAAPVVGFQSQFKAGAVIAVSFFLAVNGVEN